MSQSVEKFYWSESDETQAKIDAYLACRKKAIAAIRAFCKEVGAQDMYHSTSGACCGVEFNGKTPVGWSSKKRHLRTVPEQKTPAGKQLYKRMMALTIPTAEQYFIEKTGFSKFWGVIIDGNRISFPTAVIAKRPGERGRVMIRVRMLPGPAPKPKKNHWSSSDTQHEGSFNLPAGYHEWKEWEMLKFCEDWNARLDEKKAA